MNRAEQIAAGEISFDLLELMEQLLEPELVGLMDDDEQHLVVLGRSRTRPLESQEVLQIQIIGICERRHVATLRAMRTCVNGR